MLRRAQFDVKRQYLYSEIREHFSRRPPSADSSRVGAIPALGLGVLDWEWSPRLLVEGWMIGLLWGAFFFMRKELRYRFTLEQEGRPVPDGWGD